MFRFTILSIIFSIPIEINAGDWEDNCHYYTFAKYDEQFGRCNDALIQSVDRSVVFEGKCVTSIVMYIREKNDCVNFTETIRQILFEIGNFNATTAVFFFIK